MSLIWIFELIYIVKHSLGKRRANKQARKAPKALAAAYEQQ